MLALVSVARQGPCAVVNRKDLYRASPCSSVVICLLILSHALVLAFKTASGATCCMIDRGLESASHRYAASALCGEELGAGARLRLAASLREQAACMLVSCPPEQVPLTERHIWLLEKAQMIYQRPHSSVPLSPSLYCPALASAPTRYRHLQGVSA